MSRVVIIGAGGHGKVLADAVLAGGGSVDGFIDADAALRGGRVLGLPVLGDDDAVKAGWILINGIGSVGLPTLRMRIDAGFRRRGHAFLTVRHPAAVIGREVDLGEGCQVMAGAVIQPGGRLGRGVIVNTRAAVDHDCRLGDFVHLAPGATLSGGVVIGEGSHVGTGATVIQGIRIGSGCLIAAGAVVVADLPDGAVAAGVPARIRRGRP